MTALWQLDATDLAHLIRTGQVAADASSAGKAHVMASNPQQIAIPLLGLPSLQVPVGYLGRIRPGIQLVAARYREDLILAAGEVIEASEGPTLPVDPA